MAATASFRTNLYSGGTGSHDYGNCPTLLSHNESIAIVDAAGRNFIPELTAYTGVGGGSTNLNVDPDVVAVSYAQVRKKLVDEYRAKGIDPKRVWLQSFFEADILYWLRNEPEYGTQVILLDNASAVEGSNCGSLSRAKALYALLHILISRAQPI